MSCKRAHAYELDRRGVGLYTIYNRIKKVLRFKCMSNMDMSRKAKLMKLGYDAQHDKAVVQAKAYGKAC